MASNIQILPEPLINRIAAGEVVERPASVVKELIENAMDADSRRITIEVEDGGRRLIRITDDGEGMSREDALMAFQRHATSKIRTEEDLAAIATLGFRGEALPSIAAVSKIRLLTRLASDEVATRLTLEGGNVKESAEAASPPGTMIEVTQLFYNTPVRRKFLKAASTELAHITGLVTDLALARPHLEFRLIQDGKEVFHLTAAGDWHQRAMQIFGSEMAEQLIPVETSRAGRPARRGQIRLTGGVSRPHYTRGAKTHQFFFVNGRIIRDRLLAHALYEAYDTLLMKGRHPLAVLFLEMDSSLVDVNVHPAKREVRFRTPQEIHQTVIEAIRKVLREVTSAGLGQERVPGFGVTEGSAYGSEDEPIPPGRVEERKAEVREATATYLRRQEGWESVAPDRINPLQERKRIIPLGQIQKSYIVADVEGDLEIIDQHAAHERILYERLLSRTAGSHSSGDPETQPLLIPETLEFSARDAVLLRSHLDRLRETGLEIEEFGSASFAIRSVPTVLAQRDLKRLVSDLLDDLREWDHTATAEETRKRLAASLACHSAIRANDSLSSPEMAALLRDLQDYPAVHSCPHGRPIRRRFTLRDLEKIFGRR
jgi:DNA mismatch repair protein MutL